MKVKYKARYEVYNFKIKIHFISINIIKQKHVEFVWSAMWFGRQRLKPHLLLIYLSFLNSLLILPLLTITCEDPWQRSHLPFYFYNFVLLSKCFCLQNNKTLFYLIFYKDVRNTLRLKIKQGMFVFFNES